MLTKRTLFRYILLNFSKINPLHFYATQNISTFAADLIRRGSKK